MTAATELAEHFTELSTWVSEKLNQKIKLAPMASGASSKSFYQITSDVAQPILALHAPLPEDMRRYTHAHGVLTGAGLRLPQIHAFDLARSFAIIEKFETELFYDAINAQPADHLDHYLTAGKSTNLLQQADAQASGLPHFDEKLLDYELSLFPEYFCAKYRRQPLSTDEANDYAKICGILKANFAAQDQVVIHRDYHSRNLFVGDDETLVIDFAGALVGPRTYDAVSLMRDAYIEVPDEMQIDFLVRQWEHARQLGLAVSNDIAQVYDQYELTSLERFTKVLGQFVRLPSQDPRHKQFMQHVPRVEKLVHAIALRFRDLRPLALMIEARAK